MVFGFWGRIWQLSKFWGRIWLLSQFYAEIDNSVNFEAVFDDLVNFEVVIDNLANAEAMTIASILRLFLKIESILSCIWQSEAVGVWSEQEARMQYH